MLNHSMSTLQSMNEARAKIQSDVEASSGITFQAASPALVVAVQPPVGLRAQFLALSAASTIPRCGARSPLRHAAADDRDADAGGAGQCPHAVVKTLWDWCRGVPARHFNVVLDTTNHKEGGLVSAGALVTFALHPVTLGALVSNDDGGGCGCGGGVGCWCPVKNTVAALALSQNRSWVLQVNSSVMAEGYSVKSTATGQEVMVSQHWLPGQYSRCAFNHRWWVCNGWGTTLQVADLRDPVPPVLTRPDSFPARAVRRIAFSNTMSPDEALFLLQGLGEQCAQISVVTVDVPNLYATRSVTSTSSREWTMPSDYSFSFKRKALLLAFKDHGGVPVFLVTAEKSSGITILALVEDHNSHHCVKELAEAVIGLSQLNSTLFCVSRFTSTVPGSITEIWDCNNTAGPLRNIQHPDSGIGVWWADGGLLIHLTMLGDHTAVDLIEEASGITILRLLCKSPVSGGSSFSYTL
ncbi:hypothetical protein Pelo_17757 [Pelomyxa schiedti]|nr:hypothetical protein Pelo_17757 [Pelomyxa schiedti]